MECPKQKNPAKAKHKVRNDNRVLYTIKIPTQRLLLEAKARQIETKTGIIIGAEELTMITTLGAGNPQITLSQKMINLLVGIQLHRKTINHLLAGIQLHRRIINHLLAGIQLHRKTINHLLAGVQRHRRIINHLLAGTQLHRKTINQVIGIQVQPQITNLPQDGIKLDQTKVNLLRAGILLLQIIPGIKQDKRRNRPAHLTGGRPQQHHLQHLQQVVAGIHQNQLQLLTGEA
jgi:hypothetical protein